MRVNCEEGEAVPLETPYVVIIGSLKSADLQNPTGGQWPHYHVHVQSGATVYDSAINLKSLTNIQIEYRVRSFFDSTAFANIVALPDGLHPLAQNPSSGALDYVRDPGITGESGWILQNGDNLIRVFQAQLTNVERLYIFGAQYATGDGVHDVHMNQGDPDGSDFQHLDGIWQDGGVIFQYGPPQPRRDIIQIKFETQSLHTDDQGHPVPWPSLRPCARSRALGQPPATGRSRRCVGDISVARSMVGPGAIADRWIVADEVAGRSGVRENESVLGSVRGGATWQPAMS